jgi:hypothetical protein
MGGRALGISQDKGVGMADIVVTGFALMKGDKPVQMNSIHRSFRDEAFVVKGGMPPQHEASSGRVYVESDYGDTREYFPGVFEMKWEKRDENKNS